MMDTSSGTFHCATMHCGNNAQTNDSVVSVVSVVITAAYVRHILSLLVLDPVASLSSPLVLLSALIVKSTHFHNQSI